MGGRPLLRVRGLGGGGWFAGSKAILNLWNFAAASLAGPAPACYLLKTLPEAALRVALCSVIHPVFSGQGEGGVGGCVCLRVCAVPATECALIGRYLISVACTICGL